MRRTLQDLGEREIVRQILPKFYSGIGDDCAVLQFAEGHLIITTDPVPEPAAKLLGSDPDPYWMGWLLVIINASDLAASGANPVAFLAAIEAPPTMSIDDFERFLLGISEACAAEGLEYVGGNLREGSKLAGVGTAIGRCQVGKAIRRSGGREGDIIVSIGQGGIFWRDALIVKNGGLLPSKDLSPLFRPHSQLRAMSLLAQEEMITAAVDNSDGLLPTLVQLASATSLGAWLDLDCLTIPDHRSELEVDAAHFWLGWGDWNVIAAVAPNGLDRAMQIAVDAGSVATPIGKLVAGKPELLLRRGDVARVAPRLESERFAKDSWFGSGIQGYVDLLLSVELP
jgi:thiamine-monophosphate kinase